MLGGRTLVVGLSALAMLHTVRGKPNYTVLLEFSSS
jgi:hypothetical protein